MKKLLSVFTIVLLLLSLMGSALAQPPVAEEVRGVTIPNLSIAVNGKAVTQADLAPYPVYSVAATSINSAGTESTVTYIGFALKDVLAAAGLTQTYHWLEVAAGDGYTVSFSDPHLIAADTTLLALTKDAAPFNEAPWFAPCNDTTTGNYLKGCVSIIVNTGEGKPENVEHGVSEGSAEAATTGELPEILDRTEKVTFDAFSFLVNGTEITNQKLEGLSIYKIEATATNSKGATSGYTGYRLTDVLTACGIPNATKVIAVANDGYENVILGDLVTSPYTLVAIEKDKELGEDGTIWLAPCTETENKSYSKLVVELKAE